MDPSMTFRHVGNYSMVAKSREIVSDCSVFVCYFPTLPLLGVGYQVIQTIVPMTLLSCLIFKNLRRGKFSLVIIDYYLISLNCPPDKLPFLLFRLSFLFSIFFLSHTLLLSFLSGGHCRWKEPNWCIEYWYSVQPCLESRDSNFSFSMTIEHDYIAAMSILLTR